MPRHSPIQSSFNGGEWSPRMFGRTDISKYNSAVKLLKNFYILPQGGVQRRSGSRYVAEQGDSGMAGRLVPFVFSDDQAYILLFEDLKIRIFRNEGVLTEQEIVIASATSDIDTTTDEIIFDSHGFRHLSGPVRIATDTTLPVGLSAGVNYYIHLAQTSTFAAALVNTGSNAIDLPAHGYTDNMGPFQFDTTVTLPTGLSYETDYYVIYVSANSFGLETSVGAADVTLSGQGTGTHTMAPTNEYLRKRFRLGTTTDASTIVNITGIGAGIQTITPQAPVSAVTIDTTYSVDQLSELSIAQSADVLYITHKNHPPRKLERYSSWSFSLSDIDLIDGPYLSENDTTTTMTSGATTGNNITITSSTAIFTGSDIGRLIRIFGGGAGTFWGYAKIVSVNTVQFTDADFTTDSGVAGSIVSTGPDYITLSSHPFSTEELVTIQSSGTQPTINGVVNLPTNAWYVRDIASNRFQLHPTADDATNNTNLANFTTTGSGTLTFTSNRISILTHGYTGGEGPFTLTNTGGAVPLIGGSAPSPTQDYYVKYIGPNTLILSFTKGGAGEKVSGATGGGTHSLSGGSTPFATCKANIKVDFENTTGTTRWRMGAWGSSSDLGYPRAVTFHEQRLWFSSNPGAPQTLYGSKSADFETFSPTGAITATPSELDDDVLDDNAIVFGIASNEVNVIQWMSPGRTLLLGTTSANWSAQASLVSEPITPSNLQVRRSGALGSTSLQPAVIDDKVVYTSNTRLKLFTLGYSFDSDSYMSDDLTLLAEHITRTGVIALAYAREPWSTVWAARVDGVAPALTIVENQEVVGWARHEIGGAFVASYSLTLDSVDTSADTVRTTASHGLSTGSRIRFLGSSLPAPLVEHRDYYARKIDADDISIYATLEAAQADTDRIGITATGTGTLGQATNAVIESLAVIPAPTGDASGVGRANRAHDQVWMTVKRTINGATKRYVEFIEDHFEDDETIDNGFFLDSGITALNQTTTISGLDHIAGETVDALIDGVVNENLVVSSGGVLTVPASSAIAHIGYRYSSDLDSLRLELPSGDGTAQAKLGRLDHIVLRLHAAMGGMVGSDPGHLDPLDLLSPDQPMDEIPPLFEGDLEVALDAPWETEGGFFLRQSQPLPMTVLAVLPVLQKGARGDR